MLFLSLMAVLFQPVPNISDDYEWACPPERRAETSATLKELNDADQADRSSAPIDWDVVLPRDLTRRKEVASIFAEGCLVSGEDHLYAAQIYNHGNVPAHSYQTYLWAQRAVALGERRALRFVPRGVDRFLLANGYKQLFGANASADAMLGEDGEPTGEMGRWCLDPVAVGFTDEKRSEFDFPPLEDRLAWVEDLNNSSSSGSGEFCDVELDEPPRGMFPGIW